MGSPTINSELEELLKVVEDDLVRAYRDKYFPSRIVEACPNVYSIKNASKWVNFDKFSLFVAHALQERSPPPSPSMSRGELDNPPLKRVRASSSSANTSSSHATWHTPNSQNLMSSSLSGDSMGSGESDNDGGLGADSIPYKRKRGDNKARAPKPSAKLAAGLVKITRQCWVNRVEMITEAPENWQVPESGESVAYVIDLSADPHDYKDAKGKALAMSAIVKHKCTDGWAGGSGGSLTKPTTVSLLGDDVKCQKMSHECRGSFTCSMAAPDLWNEYKRYDHDPEATSSPLWSQQGDAGEQEGNIILAQALAFYNNVVKEKCQFDNGKCPGRPVLKPCDQYPVEGKYNYIGCSAMNNGEHGHFFRQIASHVDEERLRQLFNTGRNNFSNTVVPAGPCTFSVPPRTGLKQKQCPHIHMQDGKILEGTIIHRPCSAKITIFSPIDHSLRKAVVIPAAGVPHNHPSHPSDKLTRRAKAALRAAGIIDATTGNIDHAPTTPSDSSSSHMPAPGLSHTPLTSDSSMATPYGYHIEQFY